MSDPIDPATGRGKQQDGWKTVVMPIYSGGAAPQSSAPPQPGPPLPGYAQPQSVGQSPAPAPGQSYGQPGQPAYSPGNPGGPPQGQPQTGGYPPPPSGQGPVYIPPPQQQPQYPQYRQPPKKKRKTWLWVTLIILSFLFLGMVGCFAVFYEIGKGQMASTPDDGVRLLHERMKSQDDAAIYKEADPSYREKMTRQESDYLWDNVYKTMGPPVSYKILDTNEKGTLDEDGDVVDLRVQTTFQNGTVEEDIEFRRSDHEYRVALYSAKSIP